MTVFECGLKMATNCVTYSNHAHEVVTIAHLESMESTSGPKGYWTYEKVAACVPCRAMLSRLSQREN